MRRDRERQDIELFQFYKLLLTWSVIVYGLVKWTLILFISNPVLAMDWASSKQPTNQTDIAVHYISGVDNGI